MKKYALIFSFLLGVFTTSFSQKMSVGYIYPAGGQMGTTFEIEVGGLNVSKATGIFVSGTGVRAELIAPSQSAKKNVRKKFDDQSSPQLADKLKVKITIDRDATPGLRDFKLQDTKAVSNKLTFEVGQYPDYKESGISSFAKPNAVDKLPATLCGQIMPGERDYFSFKAQKGSVLVASVKARAFVPYIADAVPGWFQAVISLRNSKGREVAFCDDYRNEVDPVIILKIPENDTYTLLIHDAIFRGREDFNYRIEVGEIPFIESIYPVVGKKGSVCPVNISGVNIDKCIVNFKPDFEGKGLFSVIGKNGFVSNSVPFETTESAKKIVYAPTTKTLNLDQVMYDSLSRTSKSKDYEVILDTDEQLAINLIARRLASMLDARLILYNPAGDKVAESDDVEDPMEGLITHHADPVLKYKAPRAGKYKLVVEDVLQNFGKDYYYVLERKIAASEFEVFVSPANITIPRGGTTTFSLDVVTEDKKFQRFDLELIGLPNGFLTSSLEVRGNKWEVSITAPQKAKEQKLELKVIAKTKPIKKDAPVEIQQAVAADNMMQAFYYTHHIPSVGFIADVTNESPFSLHFSPGIERNLSEPIQISMSDTIFPINVYLHRNEGFNEPVALQLNRKNKQLTLDPVEFLPGETEKVVNVKLDLADLKKFKSMRRTIAIVGTVNGKVDKQGKRSFDNAQFREMTPLILLELTK